MGGLVGRENRQCLGERIKAGLAAPVPQDRLSRMGGLSSQSQPLSLYPDPPWLARPYQVCPKMCQRMEEKHIKLFLFVLLFSLPNWQSPYPNELPLIFCHYKNLNTMCYFPGGFLILQPFERFMHKLLSQVTKQPQGSYSKKIQGQS